jgi:hypothetical protein
LEALSSLPRSRLLAACRTSVPVENATVLAHRRVKIRRMHVEVTRVVQVHSRPRTKNTNNPHQASTSHALGPHWWLAAGRLAR